MLCSSGLHHSNNPFYGSVYFCVAENDDVEGEDELAKFDADFALMTRSLGDFIKELIVLFKVNEQF